MTSTLERSVDEQNLLAVNVGQSSISDAHHPSIGAPDEGGRSETEVSCQIDDMLNLAKKSVAGMVELSAVLIEEAQSSGAKFLKTLERDKNVKVTKKKEYGELVCLLL